MQNYPIAKDLVLVGGGHSHVIVLRRLAMKPMTGLQVTLVSPDVRTAYSGMLPGLVAGHYSEDDMHIDLVSLCRFAGVRFFRTRATDIDTANRQVIVQGRPPVPYDVLSLDIGITPDLGDVKGKEGVIAVKPINDFLQKWYRVLKRAEAGEIASIGVVGAGAGGVELCLSMRHRLQQHPRGQEVRFHLFSDGPSILPGYPAPVQQRFAAHLNQYGITCYDEFRVIDIDNRTLLAASGQQMAVDEAFFVTRAGSQDWLKSTGLKLDANGFIEVLSTLQSASHPEVFAVGDIAHVQAFERPKAGVFAVRQGPPLDRNLRRVLQDKPAKPFKPQERFLSIVTTGGRHAIASRGNLFREGNWVWTWKDWIDRRFMNRFRNLAPMKRKNPGGLLADFDDQMQCGGCGSKVSGDILREVLSNLGVADAMTDDAAMLEVPPGKTVLQSVDSFRSFVDDPYLFAKIAVNHALSDIYAMGGTPATALAIVTLPYATAAKTRQLLEQVLAATLEVLNVENIALAGGHTTEGPELTLGFSVTGFGDRDSLFHKAGLEPGDHLILTKPLGTGALFAADMQLKARGEWIEEAIDMMLLSNRAAADTFRAEGVRAATDITGFGLAGHLQEMVRASGVSVALTLATIPALAGSLEVLGRGTTSTLHEGNRRSADLIPPDGSVRAQLLFDPQTAGGLLAAVKPGQVEAVLSALHAAGYAHAANIGVVLNDGPPHIALN